jgi:hypothetical protein
VVARPPLFRALERDGLKDQTQRWCWASPRVPSVDLADHPGKPADAEAIWEAALNAEKVKGRPEMTKTTNPTAGEFAGLQAEVKVAERVCSNARGSKEEEASGQRVTAASKAILSARPTDPSVMAAQLRSLVAESVLDADARGALEHIAEQLEAMAADA